MLYIGWKWSYLWYTTTITEVIWKHSLISKQKAAVMTTALHEGWPMGRWYYGTSGLQRTKKGNKMLQKKFGSYLIILMVIGTYSCFWAVTAWLPDWHVSLSLCINYTVSCLPTLK